VNPLPHQLASAAPVSCLPFPAARFFTFAPVCLVHAPLPSLLLILARDGSAAANRSARAPILDPVDGDTICSKRASQRRAVGAERGRGAPGVDRPVGVGLRAQPVVQFTSSVSSGFTSAASPRRRSASCRGCATTTGWSFTTSPQRDIAGGNLHPHLRGVPWDPSELGPLGPPVLRGAAYPRHGRDAGAPGGSRQRPDILAAGVMQGIVPVVHNDVEQRGLGEGVVLPLQRWCRPPPTPARC
jgi:hypothetical protein